MAMRVTDGARTAVRAGLDGAGFPREQADLPDVRLVEEAVRRGEGRLTATGALAVATGAHTGRSPGDKYLVRDGLTAGEAWWDGPNRPMDPADFDRLHGRVVRHLRGREVFAQDLRAGADPAHRLRVRVVSERAWAALFARNLFIVPPREEGAAAAGLPEVTVLHAPELAADPARDRTRSETAIAVDAARGLVLIAGTGYAGEIKKAVFGLLQFLLPRRGVATMHCAANAGPEGDVALFFGLSGTGKTTLSTDPDRATIGDDEHGWTDRGVFNFEGGCYAKTIGLTTEAEPAIFAAASRFGTVLENVVLDPATAAPRYADDALTENTRAAFPLAAIPGAVPDGTGGHPRHVLFLTADAFGVLPPITRLDPDQALYHYLSGYTAKLAGTERGLGDPEATFSACFGEPFLALPPTRYADLLGERLRRHRPALWLVNTGWTGGPAGVGRRIALAHTRAIVRAVLAGDLDDVPTVPDPTFGVAVPTACPEVPAALLDPRSTWPDPAAYDAAARRLAADFAANFARFAGQVPPAVAAAGPRSG